MTEVLSATQFISGSQVGALEKELADYDAIHPYIEEEEIEYVVKKLKEML